MSTDASEVRSRRSLLAAAAGAVAAFIAGGLGRPAPVRASDPYDVVLGAANSSGTTTLIQNVTTDNAAIKGLGTTGDGIVGESAGDNKSGVYGFTTTTTGYGVFGRNKSYGYGVGAEGQTGLWAHGTNYGVYAQAANGNGVWATSEHSAGVRGDTASTSDFGVVGQGSLPTGLVSIGRLGGGNGVGVHGYSYAGVGVLGESHGVLGVDLKAGGTGRILQLVTATTGAPTAGTYTKGEQIRDAAGRLWLCVASGTPGTWQRVATVPSGVLGGALTLLAKPARVYDSRVSGGPMGSGQTRTISVASAIPSTGGGLAVPAGAAGIAFNLTITRTVGKGWLAVIPHGAPFAGTSSINWTAPGQTVANGGLVGLGGDRQVDVRCASNLGCSTDIIIDVTGYFI